MLNLKRSWLALGLMLAVVPLSYSQPFTIEAVDPEQSVSAGRSAAWNFVIEKADSTETDIAFIINPISPYSPAETRMDPPLFQTGSTDGYAIASVLTSEFDATQTVEFEVSAFDSISSTSRSTTFTLNIISSPYLCPDLGIPPGSVGADTIVGFTLGEQSFSTENYDVKNVEESLGLPDGDEECVGGAQSDLPITTFYSVGTGGGYLDLGFSGLSVIDQPGIDLVLVEGASWGVRQESADIVINGVTRRITQADSIGLDIFYVPGLQQVDESHWTYSYGIDLADFGVTETDRIRIADASGTFTTGGTAGFDVDGVYVLPNAIGPAQNCRTRAYITQSSGEAVVGNFAPVFAEFVSGLDPLNPEVLFQYRVSGSGSWNDMVAANSSFANPDTEAPFNFLWDVSEFADGDYEIRAVASCGGVTDTAPPVAFVAINNTNPDTMTDLTSDGDPIVTSDLDPTTRTIVGNVYPTEGTSLILEVDGTLTSGSDPEITVTMEDPGDYPEIVQFASTSIVGPAMEIKIRNSLVDNPFARDLLRFTLSYPDANDDGIIDGTGVDETLLKLYRWDNEGSGNFIELTSTIDPINNLVIAASPDNSVFFAVAGNPVSSLDDWQLIH